MSRNPRRRIRPKRESFDILILDQPKAIGKDKPKKTPDQNELLMKEIMAMGGSEQDLELFKDIDSDSEIEGDDDFAKAQNKNSKRSKSSVSEPAIEPALRNELNTFMKSLFGSSKMDRQKMELAAEEEGEEEEEEEENHTDQEDIDKSEDGWQTEEEEKNGDDPGDDSMDDLPQELKEIHTQLESRKRKTESSSTSTSSVSSKGSKKFKPEQPASVSTPAKQLQSKKPDTKKSALPEVQKQVSAILGSQGQKKGLKKDTKIAVSQKKASGSTSSSAAKAKNISMNPKAAASSSKTKKVTMAWKLGDGWNKGFENEDEDNVSFQSKSKGNAQKNKTKMKQAKPKGRSK